MADHTTRHICGISGGKDSSALAVYLRNKVPEMEYFFCDTGAELPETYEYLTRLEVVLGKPIVRLNAQRGFDHWFEVFRGTLPSPQMRWCTKNMKIKPIEGWIGEAPALSYVAIRADESNRKGYISTKPNIQTRFPFIEDGVDHDGVMQILADAGIGPIVAQTHMHWCAQRLCTSSIPHTGRPSSCSLPVRMSYTGAAGVPPCYRSTNWRFR